MQLIAVEFTPGGRSYTYHNTGEPVRVDEEVVVMTNRGPQTVLVVSTNPPTPKVPTKPIIGKADRHQHRRPHQRTLL
jgi:hypothetical protein